MSTTTHHHVPRSVGAAARRTAAEYSPGEPLPLGSFAGLIGTYAMAVGGLALAGRRRGVRARPAWSDLALAAVATHHTARLVSKDAVSGVLRAPVARRGERGAPGETNDEPRGTGPRRALGELITCPFCIGQWLGTAWVAGFAFAPRLTRWAAAAMTVVTAADALQFGWTKLDSLSE